MFQIFYCIYNRGLSLSRIIVRKLLFSYHLLPNLDFLGISSYQVLKSSLRCKILISGLYIFLFYSLSINIFDPLTLSTNNFLIILTSERSSDLAHYRRVPSIASYPSEILNNPNTITGPTLVPNV